MSKSASSTFAESHALVFHLGVANHDILHDYMGIVTLITALNANGLPCLPSRASRADPTCSLVSSAPGRAIRRSQHLYSPVKAPNSLNKATPNPGQPQWASDPHAILP